MGVIIRQSFKTSLVNFTGAVIGMVSVLFVYPLQPEAVGFANNFYSIGTFIAPFIALGVTSLSIRYFPEFSNQRSEGKTGFLGLLLLAIILNFIIFATLVFFFKAHFYHLLEQFHFDSTTFSNYELQIGLLSLLLVLISLITSYISNFGRIVVPSLVVNFGYKLYLPMVILLIYFGYFGFSSLTFFILAFNILAGVVLVFYLGKLKGLDLKFSRLKVSSKKLKEMINYSLLSGLTGLGGILAYRIDTIMISGFLGYMATGTYVLPMTMAAIMDIPNIAVGNISGPIISKALQVDNSQEISDIYKKSSLNLLVFGVLILMGGWFCFEDLANISSNPKIFDGMKYIFLILGFTKLVDMLTSVNNSIIAYSRYYQYNLLFVLILGILNIFLNIRLIPLYGLPGAAFATFISMSSFNLFKLVFIYHKMRIHPFSRPLIKLFFISLVTLLSALTIPSTGLPFLNILLKTVLISAIYGGMIYFSKISPDMNNALRAVIARLKF